MIHAELKNFDQLHAALDYDPLYLDDFDAHIEEDRETLNNLLFTRYGRNDTLSSVPACACGQLHGREQEGERCRSCGHECAPTYTRAIEPVLWVRVPDGITYFVNPTVWKMLFNILKSGSNSLLLWLTDPRYIPNLPDDPKIRKLQDLHITLPGYKRGINYFTEHYAQIIDAMLDQKIINARSWERSGMRLLYERYHECFFTTVLPVPNRNTVVIEQNGTVLDADTMALAGIDVFLTINNMHHRRVKTPVATKESEVAQCMMRLATYFEKYMSLKIFPKPGKIRKHVVGSRLHFTARAVISSLHRPHHYQELHIPWGVGVEVFKEHIRAKMLHVHRLSPIAINDILNCHVSSYHPLVDQCLKDIIAESEYHDMEGNHLGYPCCLQRNPSLARGSIWRVSASR